MPNLQHKRGTKTALDALAGSSGLLAGQVYIVTDLPAIAVATSTSAYDLYYRNPKVTVSATAPSSPADGDFWLDIS